MSSAIQNDSPILSGVESQRLRSFCSDAVWSSADLDEYALLIQKGSVDDIIQDFENHASAAYLEAAREDLAGIRYGPGEIPLYNYLLQLVYMHPGARGKLLSMIRYLAETAKVPVDSTDLSGTTTLMHCISTKPYFEPEVADILLRAGANINHRNRYGSVAAHDAVMARDYSVLGKRKTSDAVRYFVNNGGDLDVQDGDGITPRSIANMFKLKIPELYRFAAEAASVPGPACGACGARGIPLMTCARRDCLLARDKFEDVFRQTDIVYGLVDPSYHVQLLFPDLRQSACCTFKGLRYCSHSSPEIEGRNQIEAQRPENPSRHNWLTPLKYQIVDYQQFESGPAHEVKNLVIAA